MAIARHSCLHLAAGAAALPAASRMAGAQNYPSRQITMIVPFAAGGPADTVARIMARPAIRDREPPGRRQQHRHRGGARRARFAKFIKDESEKWSNAIKITGIRVE